MTEKTKNPVHETKARRPNVVLVGVHTQDIDETEFLASLDELENLVRGLGYHVVGRLTQRRAGSSSTVLGPGKLAELAEMTVRAMDSDDPALASQEPTSHGLLEDGAQPLAECIVVDDELSGGQLRFLETKLGVPILDRTSVIVEVFERRAQTREAQLQVELARRTYELPRVRDSERTAHQEGGGGRGGKGQSNVELRKQTLKERITVLRRELMALERSHRVESHRRQDRPRVALVGYTNAGKSSLMRGLTGSQVLAEDKLFATLGTTVRALQPETKPRILVSDTVGFLRKLPHSLLASFRSTLREANEAGLLLLVIDATDSDPRRQLAVTEQALAEIGATAIARRLVVNKVDQVSEAALAVLREQFPDALFTCAHDLESIRRVREAIVTFFDETMRSEEFFVPYARGRLLGVMRAQAHVVAERYEALGTVVTLRATERVLQGMKKLCDQVSGEISALPEAASERLP